MLSTLQFNGPLFSNSVELRMTDITETEQSGERMSGRRYQKGSTGERQQRSLMERRTQRTPL